MASMATQAALSSPAAEAWQVEYARMLPELERLANNKVTPWPLRVLRSSQLDAQRLDAELTTMLQEQFMAAFQLFQPGRISNLAPELNLLLAFLVYWLSIWQGRATPGSELMNLRYRNERAMEAAATAASSNQAVKLPWLHGGRTGIEGPGLSHDQKLGYAFAFVALPYLWVRLNRYAAQMEWGQRQDDRNGVMAWRLLRAADAAHKLGQVLNLWVFLYEGKYRTLAERLLGARLIYKQANMSRLISFEYLNRQLVWQELSEFLLFLLPLINVARVKRYILKLLPRVPLMSGRGSSMIGSPGLSQQQQYPVAAETWDSSAKQQQQHEEACEADDSNSMSTVSDLLRPVGPCPICGVKEILVPFVAFPCRHLFCYYCLRSHTEADQGFCCPVDGHRVESMQRYSVKMPT